MAYNCVSLDVLTKLDESEVKNDDGYWGCNYLAKGTNGEGKNAITGNLLLPNCTTFCVGAWSWCVQSEHMYTEILGDGKSWYDVWENKGKPVGNTPIYASIICLTGGDQGYGHVAFVYDYKETDAPSGESGTWYELNIYDSGFDYNKSKELANYFRIRRFKACVGKKLYISDYTEGDNFGGSNFNVKGYLYNPDYIYEEDVDRKVEDPETKETKTYRITKQTVTSIDDDLLKLAQTDEHWDKYFVDGGRAMSLTNQSAFALGAWSWCYGAIAEDQTFEKFLKRGYLGYPECPRHLYSEYAFDKTSTPSLAALVCLDKTDEYPNGRVGMFTTFSDSDSKTVVSFFDVVDSEIKINKVQFDSAPTVGCSWTNAGGGYCVGYMKHPYFNKYKWVIKES